MDPMVDLRLWSRELIAEFIEKYKSYPCLWKVKCDQYKNKYYKTAAYKELVQFCKKRGFPDATRDFVVRKLQSLRGSFRKELRKTIESKRAGKNHQPNLWYYNNLLFTKDQESETAEDADEDRNQSEEDTCQSNEDNYEVEDEEKFMVEQKPSTKVVQVSDYSADSPSPPPQRKRKRTTEDFLQPEFLDIGLEIPKHKDLTEFEITGLGISKKLARMDPIQAIYAESIINNVIRKGLLRKLTEETDICDNMCKRIMTVADVPSQSSSNSEVVSLGDIRIMNNASM